MNNVIPKYLVDKLLSIGIVDVYQIQQVGYLKIFKWLRDFYPQISYRVLFDIFSISNHLGINTIDDAMKRKLIVEYKNLLPTYLPLSQVVVNQYMQVALEYAKKAYSMNEVPIGAIVVKDNQVIAGGYNKTNGVLAHAEIEAIASAQTRMNNYRLNECDIYVTVEPCLMCSGAIINARMRRLIFGAVEPLTGACVSQFRVFNNSKINHFTEVVGPIDSQVYGALMRDFFISKRGKSEL